MDPLTVLLVSALLVGPAPTAPVVFREVSSLDVSTGWVDGGPGLQTLVDGTYRTNVLVLATGDPLVFRFVFKVGFQGTLGVRTVDNATGAVIEAVTRQMVNDQSYVGTTTLNTTSGEFDVATGFFIQRVVSHSTVTVGDLEFTGSFQIIVLFKFVDGNIAWGQIRVRFGA